MMYTNIKNENQFVQDFLLEPSHLEFNTWYANQVCQNLLFLTENRVKCVAVVMQDGINFDSQLEALLMICRKMNKNGYFICKEPGNNSHYICGLYSNNQLILINPMGITSHKDFYTLVNQVKKKHFIQKVYLSSSRIQNENYEKQAIVSCGAIVTELGMHILNNDPYKLEELLKHISKPTKVNTKEGLDYYCIESLDILLPQTLSNLLESDSEDDYKNKILFIRKEHLNKLKDLPPKLANSQELSVINKYLDSLKEGSNSQKIFNKILLEKKYTLTNIADETEYKLLALELNNSATSQYLAHANQAKYESAAASIKVTDNLEDLFYKLENIADINYKYLPNNDAWAKSYRINQALDNCLKDNGEYLAHIMNTELSSVHTLVNSEEGARDYAEKIVGYQDSAGEMHETGYVHNDGGELKKPVVMIVNTSTAVASSKQDFSAEGGTHWQTCVILPKNYKPKFAECLNNQTEILFYLDSLNNGVKTPEKFKQILMEGTSYQFTSDQGKSAEEIIHSVTRRIPALCKNMKFIDGLTTNQQLGGTDCGWWALYNALMIVFTGRIDYLQQFKSPSRENGYKLRAIFPELHVDEQINQNSNAMKFSSHAYGYDAAQDCYNYNDLSAGTNTVNIFPNVSKSIPIIGEMHQGVQNKFVNTAELEKEAITEEYAKQDFPGNVVVSENGLYLAVIESVEDSAKIEVFELNKNNGQLFNTAIKLVYLSDVKTQKITNVKISNDGRYLFYIEDESSENDSDKSVYYIDFHLESPLPIKLCHEKQWREVLSDYIISSNGHFILLKYTIHKAYGNGIIITFSIPDTDWRIVDVLENKFINNLKSCDGVSFIDNDIVIYWNNNVLRKLSISKLKAQSEDFTETLSTDKKINIPSNSLCVLHPNKSRILFVIKEGLNPNALFYDINSKRFNRTSIPELRYVSKVLFLPGERLLCVSEYTSFNIQQSKKNKLVILDLKDGKAKRPIYLNFPLNNFDHIGVNPTGASVVVSSGKNVCYVNLPQISNKKQYFFQYNNLVVSGKELLKLGYDAFNSIYENATTPNANAIFTKNIFSSNTLKIESGKDWILTAGHLSMFPTGIDKRKDKWYPSNVSFFHSEYTIKIIDVRGDAFVKFPNTDGSYVAISEYLHKMTEVELPPIDIEKIISCILNNKSVEIDNNPSNHSDIAKTLLSRLGGNQYPTNYTVEQKMFFDALLVLMFGVEGSRNNLTFLTGVMLLDLIASNTPYGRKGHQYNWNNAFVSGPKFKWNDFENKDYGGKFPMATNSTGTGNMKQRKEFISNAQHNKLRDFQRERVQIREMSIITHWLQAFSSKYNNYFSNCSSSLDMQNSIIELFKIRLKCLFLEPNNLEFLSYNTPNRGMHSSLKRHYKDESFVYFLRHKAINESQQKLDEFYHRTDHPCKTLPGFVLSGKSKDITALKTKITAELTVVKKELTYITKTNSSFAGFLKNITADLKDFAIKGKMIKIIVAYNKWITSYFNAAAFGSIENNIFSNVVMQSHFSYMRDDLAEKILNNLEWDMGSSNTEGRITREQIKKIIKDFNDEKYIEFLKNDLDVNIYIDKFIKALQSVVDPLMDFDKSKFMVNLDICMPNYDERGEKICNLLSDSGINYPAENEAEINDILTKLGEFEPNFRFDVGFNIAQTPCQSCYSTYSEPYPSLPYNHDNTICLYNETHDYYHRIDSSCSNISYEDNRHVFREEPQQSTLLILRDRERDPNNVRPGTYILQSSPENEMYMQNQTLSNTIWSIFYIDRNLHKRALQIDDIEGLKEELSNRYISVSDTLKNIIQKYHSNVNSSLELRAKFVYEAKENGKKACGNCWWELDHSFKSDTSVDKPNIGYEKITKIQGGIISRAFGIKKHKIEDDRTSLVETRDSLPIFTPAYKQVNSDRLISKDLSKEIKSSENMKPSL